MARPPASPSHSAVARRRRPLRRPPGWGCKGLLPKLAEVGFDAIEAITPKPAGDLEIEEIRPTSRSSTIILWGGVPGVMFSPPYTWEDMKAHVARVLRSWRGQPFILGVADQVPPDGDIDFCRRIADLIAEQTEDTKI